MCFIHSKWTHRGLHLNSSRVKLRNKLTQVLNQARKISGEKQTLPQDIVGLACVYVSVLTDCQKTNFHCMYI